MRYCLGRSLLRRWIFAVSLFLYSVTAASQESGNKEEIHLTLLKTVRIATIFQIELAHLCIKAPERVPTILCKKRLSIPNEVIEHAALPTYRKLVPEWAAKEIIETYNSSTWQKLQPKLLDVLRTNDLSLLNKEDEAEMARFQKTAASAELMKAAKNIYNGAALFAAARDYVEAN